MSQRDELTNETVREMMSAMEKKDVQRQLNVLRAFVEISRRRRRAISLISCVEFFPTHPM